MESVFFFAELPPDERIRERRIFRPSAPLVAHDLIKLEVPGRLDDPGQLIDARIVMPTRTFNYLIGDRELADDIQEFSSIEEPRAAFAQVVIPDDDKRRILDAVEQHDRYLAVRQKWGFDELIRYGRGLTMLFSGPPGTGKTMTAHAIAGHLGKRVLRVDLLGFMSRKANHDLLAGVFREARLHDAVPFFDECEVLFQDRERGNFLMNLFLTELERFDGVAILATNSPEMLDPALIRRMLVRVRFPEPDAGARAAIWAHHLPRAAIRVQVPRPSESRRLLPEAP